MARLGLDVFGIDLSLGMVEVARRENPDLRFEAGSMAALDLPDGGLAGALAGYSLIHIPTVDLPPVLAELYRVLAPGGRLVVAFQVGEQPRPAGRPAIPGGPRQAYGHDVSIILYPRTPEQYENLLVAAGFAVIHRLLKEPEGAESEQQGYLLARRPA